MKCENCGAEEIKVDYKGEDDVLGKSVPGGKFCSTECLFEYIENELK